MKKRGALLLCIGLLIGVFAAPLTVGASYALPDDVSLSARSAILVYLGDSSEQDVTLFERNADTRRSPAATVRVMVGLYAVRLIRERGLDIDTATGTYDKACYSQITGSGLSVANMQIGDTWTLRDLLTASMADTAADACVTLCHTLAGSVSAFVDGMNYLAADMGLQNTSFSNVTGLDAMGQYTTARELAQILRAAMEYPELTAMMGTATYDVNPIVGRKQSRPSVNSMLRPITDCYYRKLAFGRTGYADEAGRCMASVAKSGGYNYMAVVMGCAAPDGSDRGIAHFEDTEALFEWAFASFSYKTLLSAGQPVGQLPVAVAWSVDTAPLVAGESFGTVVPNDLDIGTVILKPVLAVDGAVDAPIEKGASYGTVELYINLDQKLGEVPLVAGASVERSQVLVVWRMIGRIFSSKWLYVAIVLVILLIAGYAALSVVHNRRRRRR